MIFLLAEHKGCSQELRDVFLVCHRLMLLAIYFSHFINNDYNCPDVVFKYPSVQRNAKLCMLAGVAQAVTI